jgi:uncharacterized protein YjbI with pentapeptide repeats
MTGVAEDAAGELSPEAELRASILLGRPVRRGGDELAADGGDWGEERQLPGALLRELLAGPEEGAPPRAAILIGLRITGRVDLEAADVRAPLIAHNCRFDEPANLSGVRASEIRLTGCALPGLTADYAELHGGLDLSRSEIGVVSLDGVRIAGSLDLSHATLAGGLWPIDHGDGMLCPPERLPTPLPGVALYADGMFVEGKVACGRLRAEGLVTLRHAHVVGPLSGHGAELARGFMADGLRADADVFLREGFHARGPVRLLGARIRGQLTFAGATLEEGLRADQLHVRDSLFFRDGFSSGGQLRLVGACVEGQLSLGGAILHGTPMSLDLENARIARALDLRFAAAPAGAIDLTSASLGSLWDTPDTWPPELRLDGCTYGSLSEYPHAPNGSRLKRALWRVWRELRPSVSPEVNARLRWIRLGEEVSRQRLLRLRVRPVQSFLAARYLAQPYTQLMSVFRQEGRDDDARQVGYERERRRSGQLHLRGRMWNWFLRWTVGYGFRPLRALVILGMLMMVGSLAFSSFHEQGDLPALRQRHPQFVASIYTLDRLVPVVSFGLRDAFSPREGAQWWAAGYTVLGWMLTVAVIAGLNAAVRRE